MVQAVSGPPNNADNTVMSNAIVVNANELPVQLLEEVNAFIKGKLDRYGIKLELHWGEGTISKMVSLAQDRAGVTQDKKVRRSGTQGFQRVQAVFVLEKINELILGILLKEGWQPRFGGTNPKGDTATMKFVKADKAADDAIGKLVSSMANDKAQAEKVEAVEHKNRRIMALVEETGDPELLEKIRKIGFEILPAE